MHLQGGFFHRSQWFKKKFSWAQALKFFTYIPNWTHEDTQIKDRSTLIIFQMQISAKKLRLIFFPHKNQFNCTKL